MMTDPVPKNWLRKLIEGIAVPLTVSVALIILGFSARMIRNTFIVEDNKITLDLHTMRIEAVEKSEERHGLKIATLDHELQQQRTEEQRHYDELSRKMDNNMTVLIQNIQAQK